MVMVVPVMLASVWAVTVAAVAAVVVVVRHAATQSLSSSPLPLPRTSAANGATSCTRTTSVPLNVTSGSSTATTVTYLVLAMERSGKQTKASISLGKFCIIFPSRFWGGGGRNGGQKAMCQKKQKEAVRANARSTRTLESERDANPYGIKYTAWVRRQDAGGGGECQIMHVQLGEEDIRRSKTYAGTYAALVV